MTFSGLSNDQIVASEKHQKGCKKRKEQKEPLEQDLPRADLQLSLQVNTIGISVIDASPKERIHITFESLDFNYNILSASRTHLELGINNIFVQNQHFDTQLPIAVTPYFYSKYNESNRTLVFLLIRENVEEFDKILNVAFTLAPLEIELDETLIVDLVAYVNFIQATFSKKEEKNSELRVFIHNGLEPSWQLEFYSYDPQANSMLDLANSTLSTEKKYSNSRKIFIQSMVIDPIEFSLTIQECGSHTKRKNLVQLLADWGLALTSIESTEIKLNGYHIENVLQPKTQFFLTLSEYYKSQGIRELYKIVGSVELLGNPAGLINSFRAGFTEILVDPVVTLFNSPTKFGHTLWRGGIGFVQHTVYGVFKSVGTFTGGIGKVFTALSYDKEFKTKMRALRSKRTKNVSNRFEVGVMTLTYGLYQGITGIVVEPFKGVKQGGVGGLFKGVFRGLIGTVTKPAAGLIGSVSTAFTGIGYMAKKKHNTRTPLLTRLPMPFYKDKILREYDLTNALGQIALRNYNDMFKHEKVLFCGDYCHKKTGMILVVCKKGFFVLRKKDYQGINYLRTDMCATPVLNDNKYIHLLVRSVTIKKLWSLRNNCRIWERFVADSRVSVCIDISTMKPEVLSFLASALEVYAQIMEKPVGAGV